MAHQVPQDPYLVLGVPRGASLRAIREAYIARARIIHPDRFDRELQPDDWRKANEMLVELNAAYEVLREGATKRAAPTPPSQPTPSAQPRSTPPKWGAEVLRSGSAYFGTLPPNVQAQLLRRQAQTGGGQVQFPLWSPGWNYGYIALLTLWFAYLFNEAASRQWSSDEQWWCAIITLGVGALVGRNVLTISSWHRSKLRPFFYFTPLYFIHTDRDNVRYWPLWALNGIAVTHNHRNGAYQNSTIRLTLDDHAQDLTVSSHEYVKKVLTALETYDDRLRAAVQSGDHSYIRSNDDFVGVTPSEVSHRNRTRMSRPLVYGSAVVGALLLFLAARQVSESAASKRWYSHYNSAEQTPHTETTLEMLEAEAKRSSDAKQQGGGRGARPGPGPASGSTARPAVTAPSAVRPVPPQEPPPTGTIKRFSADNPIAPFEIRGASGSHYLLKLVDLHTRKVALTIFVRAETTVNVEVPIGRYELRYAAGVVWYGDEYLFGPDTAYSKADDSLDFTVRGREVSGVSITLYKVVNGNLSTTMIDAAQF